MATETGHDYILPAVVIQVAESSPAPRHRSRTSGINPFEPATMIDRQQRQFEIVQRRIDVFHIVQYMALSHEQVFPSVVVEVLQANSPAGAPTGEHTQAGFETAIAERTSAVVMIHTVNFPG